MTGLLGAKRLLRVGTGRWGPQRAFVALSSRLRAGPSEVDPGYGCPDWLVQQLLRACAPVSITAAAFLIRLLRVEWSHTGKRVAILSQQLLRPTVAFGAIVVETRAEVVRLARRSW
jgi:hypothetical protein